MKEVHEDDKMKKGKMMVRNWKRNRRRGEEEMSCLSSGLQQQRPYDTWGYVNELKLINYKAVVTKP